MNRSTITEVEACLGHLDLLLLRHLAEDYTKPRVYPMVAVLSTLLGRRGSWEGLLPEPGRPVL